LPLAQDSTTYRIGAVGGAAAATIHPLPIPQMKPLLLAGVRLAFGFWLVFPVSIVSAQTPTGTLEGRIFSETSGTYLSNARVSVGADLQTFTDEFGHYRFPAVPAGSAPVRVFYTGLPAQEKAVTIAAGQRVTQDFTLGGTSDPNAPVQLGAFVVASSRDMTAAALAVNEQRFTQSIKTVASTDSFGDIADGNVGEFVNFSPA